MNKKTIEIIYWLMILIIYCTLLVIGIEVNEVVLIYSGLTVGIFGSIIGIVFIYSDIIIKKEEKGDRKMKSEIKDVMNLFLIVWIPPCIFGLIYYDRTNLDSLAIASGVVLLGVIFLLCKINKKGGERW